MANKDEKLSMCMITQQYNADLWDSSIWNEKDLNGFDVGAMTAKIAKLLHDAGAEVEAVHGITHDKDMRERWDDKVKSYVIEPKHLHGHWVVKFKDRDNGLSIPKIAKVVGLEPQFIEKAQKGRWAYDNMLAYLIHAKDGDKHQYSYKEVVSVVADKVPTYDEIYFEKKRSWEVGRAKKTADKAKSDDTFEDLYEKVITGQVTRDEVLLTDSYYTIYSRNIDKFEKGFKAYGDRKILQALRDLEAGKFNMKVLYFHGLPDAGKSRTARAVADTLIEKAAQNGERWSVCQAAATNPVDAYNGEEILIMDDLRGSAMTASDWLKLLDPYNSSPSSARYKNKTVVSRYIFITSAQDVYDFFYDTRNASTQRSEPLDQFLRRILALVKVFSVNEFEVHPKVKYEYTKQIEKPGKDKGKYEVLTLRHGFSSRGLKFTTENLSLFADYLYSEDKQSLMLSEAQNMQDGLLKLVEEINQKNGQALNLETGEVEPVPWAPDVVTLDDVLNGDIS
jgi:DNA polymerase III delta prime subunit